MPVLSRHVFSESLPHTHPPQRIKQLDAIAITSTNMGNSSSMDLTAYEDACKTDKDVSRFDDALKTRTEKVLNTLANGVDEEHTLSFDSLKEITTSLLEMDQEVVKVILEYKKDVWNNSELFQLVEEFFDNSLATLDFCSTLDKSIKAARDNQLIIQMALSSVPTSGELKETDCEKIMKELRIFQNTPNPFGEDFVRMFNKVRERHVQMLQKLMEKKRKLDRKLKRVKVWKKVSTIMFGTILAVLFICSVVAAVMAAPPIASALAAASSIPLESMGRWVKSLWTGYERELKAQRELVQDMRMGTYVAIKDLDTINILVANLENEMRSVNFSIQFLNERKDPLAIQMCVADISRKRDAFIAELDEFELHINRCRTRILQARAIVQQRIIRCPERRRQPGSF